MLIRQLLPAITMDQSNEGGGRSNVVDGASSRQTPTVAIEEGII